MAEARGSDFWSRRRAAVQKEEKALHAAQQAAEEARLDAERDVALAEKSDEEILTELGLPDPDTLKLGDNFAAFMARAVPEHLRRRALRKLWVSNPVLANLDGLVEYGEDYTDAARASEVVTSAYEVGRGLVGRARDLAERAEVVAEQVQEQAQEAHEEPAPEQRPLRSADRHAAQPVEDMDEDPAPMPRRHMRFVFEQ